MSDDPFAFMVPPLRRLMELREARDRAKAAAESAEKAYRSQEATVHEQMKSIGKNAVVTLDLGPPYGRVKFQRNETTYGKVYDHAEAVKQAKALGRDNDLLMPASSVKFRGKALNDFVKETLEHGGDLPPGFEPNIRKFVSISRK